MGNERLKENFARIGARVKVQVKAPRILGQRIAIDIARDGKGEFFELRVQPGASLAIDAIDVRARERHLLLAVRDEDRFGLPIGAGERFLCGHDERAWFVAAVPKGRGASNVFKAMDALKPREVLDSIARSAVPFDRRHRRKTTGFVRQGEWFFVPAVGAAMPIGEIRRDEALARTGGKPHMAEFAIRVGGEHVYFDRRTGSVISLNEYVSLQRNEPARARRYSAQRRNMRVFVRGRVRHADHATIVLRDWHEVFMNTENESEAKRFVAFID